METIGRVLMRGFAAGSGAKASSGRLRARGLRWAAANSSRLGQVGCPSVDDINPALPEGP